MNIRLVTRGSKLAMWQANHVASLLERKGISCEIKPLETIGDKILDVSIAKIGSKGVFTEELETSLRDGTADIAVHSAKDMPSELPDGFELIAFTEREKVNDVLVSRNEHINLDDEVIIGTSSTRRTALLKHYFPKVRAKSIRGNLQTRIRKMEEGHCDALLLAYAGIHRMEYDSLIQEELQVSIFTPPVGQGSVTIEIFHALDPDKIERIREAVNHETTEICLRAERSFLKELQGGCSIPAFGYATLENGVVTMETGLVKLDGTRIIRKNGHAPVASSLQLGKTLALEIKRDGGAEILKEIKQKTNEER